LSKCQHGSFPSFSDACCHIINQRTPNITFYLAKTYLNFSLSSLFQKKKIKERKKEREKLSLMLVQSFLFKKKEKVIPRHYVRTWKEKRKRKKNMNFIFICDIHFCCLRSCAYFYRIMFLLHNMNKRNEKFYLALFAVRVTSSYTKNCSVLQMTIL
jgi:hypothetical protein